MNKIVLLLASVVVVTASAETIDLASGGLSLDTLAAGTDYTNSGTEVADLTVTTAAIRRRTSRPAWRIR